MSVAGACDLFQRDRRLFVFLFAFLFLSPATAQEIGVPAAPSAPLVNRGLGNPPAAVLRTTPRKNWEGFLRAAREGRFGESAHYLDLGDVAPAQQPLVGPDRARKLYDILKAQGIPVPQNDELPDVTDPPPQAGQQPGYWVVLQFLHEPSGVQGQIRFQRFLLPEPNQPVWLFDSSTVSSVSAWHSRIVDRQISTKQVQRLNAGLAEPPEDLDRSTPARSLRSFLVSMREGQLNRAVHSLWLNHLAPERQPSRGRALSRRLKFVLDQKLWIDFDRVSDLPYGTPESSEIPENEDELGTIALGAEMHPIRMARVSRGDQDDVWVFSQETVQAISPLYSTYGIGPFVDWMPEFLNRYRFLELELWQWAGLLLGLLVAYVVASLLQWALLGAAGAIAGRTKAAWDDHFIVLARGPVRALFFLLILRWLFLQLRPSQPVVEVIDQVFYPLVVLACAWLISRLVRAVTILIEEYLSVGIQSESLRRAASTRVVVVRRVLNFLIGLVAISLVLMRFEIVRSVGTGLLASAGLAGLAIGLAAQATLSSLLSGIQLAITQPVRIGDSIIFDGEFGTVEEISLTYVVVRIWDLRRLVVPIQSLLSKPIQNWTRTSPELLGTVYFYADFDVDVEAARQEALSHVEGSELWDHKAAGMVVTDILQDAVQLRVLLSAANAGELWNLRCLVREKMLTWLRRTGSMPRVRYLAAKNDAPLSPGETAPAAPGQEA